MGIRKHGGNFSGDTVAMNLGDARVLDYVEATRPWVRAAYGPILRMSKAERRRGAICGAFARRDYAQVAAILPLVPPELLTASVKVRGAVAALPAWLRVGVGEALLFIGTARARLSGGGRRLANLRPPS